jgi:hypothetical protein
VTASTPRGLCAAVVALAIAGGACAGAGRAKQSGPASVDLVPIVRLVRSAAEAFDRQGLNDALAALQRGVVIDESRGDITPEKGAQILRAAQGVESIVATGASTSSSSPTPAVAAATSTSTLPEPHRPHGGKDANHSKGGPGD